MRYLLLLLLALSAPATLAQESRPDTQGHDQYREPGFVALAFLISDSTFFQQWQRPEPPQIREDTRYVRGELAYPILIFQTDAVDDEGNANLSYDLSVTKPDGTPYNGSPFTGILAWEGAPTPAYSLALGQAHIFVEEDDPVGVYTVGITVHDNVRGKSFPLALSFEVEE